MDFTVVIPARLASTRLPNKPLADIGGAPMVVRVAQAASRSSARDVVVCADHASIIEACNAHGVRALMTRTDHASGSDRLAETCDLLGLADDATIVNVQGDEPFIDPHLIDAVAQLLDPIFESKSPHVGVGTACHAIEDIADWRNPNVVKLVRDAHGQALYFSRAPIPWWRDGSQPNAAALPPVASTALRHIGIYSYRVGTLRAFAKWPQSALESIEALEQLRLLHHGVKIGVHLAAAAPAAGVDTPEDLARARDWWQKTRENLAP